MLGADAVVVGPTLGTCVTQVQGMGQPRRQRPDRKSAGTLGAPPRPALTSRALKVLPHCRGSCDSLGPGFLLAQSHPLLSETPRLAAAPRPWAGGRGLRAWPTRLATVTCPQQFWLRWGLPQKRAFSPRIPRRPPKGPG